MPPRALTRRSKRRRRIGTPFVQSSTKTRLRRREIRQRRGELRKPARSGSWSDETTGPAGPARSRRRDDSDVTPRVRVPDRQVYSRDRRAPESNRQLCSCANADQLREGNSTRLGKLNPTSSGRVTTATHRARVSVATFAIRPRPPPGNDAPNTETERGDRLESDEAWRGVLAGRQRNRPKHPTVAIDRRRPAKTSWRTPTSRRGEGELGPGPLDFPNAPTRPTHVPRDPRAFTISPP